MSFPEVELGLVCRIVPGFAFRGKDLGDDGVQVLKIGNISDDRSVDMSTAQRLPGSLIKERHKKFFLIDKDIVVAMTGATAGKVGRLRTEEDVLLNQRVAKIEAEKINPEFLWIILSSPKYRNIFFHLAGGAAQPNMSGKQIEKVSIPLPDVSTQNQIASILATYDDLIENNRRRITLLEEAARQLYKEWFVRFRYPGHEHVPIVDGVPEGWEKKEVADVVNFQGGFAFKSKSYLETGKYGIVTIKNVHDGQFIPDCTAFLDKIPSKVKPYCKLSSGDILMSLTGNIGRVCLVVGDNYLLNQRVTKIDPVSGYRTFAYFTFRSKDMQIRLKNLSHGAAQQNLSPINTGKLSIVVPVSPLLAQFEDFGGPVLKQIVVLNHANQQLAKARDLLLPKLMNGEIAV